MKGFSLVELLVVLLIMVATTTLTMTGMGRLVRASQLGMAGGTVMDQFNLARQHALASNRMVEVRIYTDGSAVGGAPCGIQIFSVSNQGSSEVFEALAPPRRLPKHVAIVDDTAVSTLMGVLSSQPVTPTPGMPYNEYYSFRFLPNGSTSLDDAQPYWFVTLAESGRSDGDNGTPSNFVAAQINVRTGQTRLWRP